MDYSQFPRAGIGDEDHENNFKADRNLIQGKVSTGIRDNVAWLRADAELIARKIEESESWRMGNPVYTLMVRNSLRCCGLIVLVRDAASLPQTRPNARQCNAFHSIQLHLLFSPPRCRSTVSWNHDKRPHLVCGARDLLTSQIVQFPVFCFVARLTFHDYIHTFPFSDHPRQTCLRHYWILACSSLKQAAVSMPPRMLTVQ